MYQISCKFETLQALIFTPKNDSRLNSKTPSCAQMSCVEEKSQHTTNTKEAINWQRTKDHEIFCLIFHLYMEWGRGDKSWRN